MLFSVICALIDGGITPDSFENNRFLDADVLGLIGRTEVEVLDEFTQATPGERNCRIHAKTKTGETVTAHKIVTLAEIEKGMSDTELEENSAVASPALSILGAPMPCWRRRGHSIAPKPWTALSTLSLSERVCSTTEVQFMLRRTFLGLAILLAGAMPAFAEVTLVRVGRAPGLAFLPLFVMEASKLLEKHLALNGLQGVTVVWQEYTSGNVMNDALLSGNMEFANGGLPPFLLCGLKRAARAARSARSPPSATCPRS